MISFKNKGLIDIRAVTTFGVSVKETENPIGFFGTGIKYAIAIILRHGGTITIWRGKEAHTFFTREEEIRGAPFKTIWMKAPHGDPDVVPLGFTTEYGKKWEMWQAFRELYCNTHDELEPVVQEGELAPDPHSTTIWVDCAEMDTAYARRGDIILEGRVPFVTSAMCEAYDGETKHLYYRNVRVYRGVRPYGFTYNLRTQIELTEDRTLAYEFRARYAIASLVLGSTDRKFIRHWITMPDAYAEYHVDLNEPNMTPGEVFLDVVGEVRRENKDTCMNKSAITLHRKRREKSVLPTVSVPLNSIQQDQLDRAKAFVHTILGCDMNRYPLIISDDLGPNGLGRADAETETIYVALKCFSEGTRWVAMALLEEYTHLAERVADETYEQKICYLKLIMTLGEKIAGRSL